MQEILVSFHIGKRYGSHVMDFRTLHFIYVTKNKVIGTFTNDDGKMFVSDFTYNTFKKCYGFDIEEMMFNRNRKEKLKEIKRLINDINQDLK